MYAGIQGRFLSRDPMPINGTPILLYQHPYAYARNNPVRWTDPSGMDISGDGLPAEPPPFPAPGTKGNPMPNDTHWIGANLCLFAPTCKENRLSPIPGLKPPSSGTPVGVGGGSHNWYGLPSTTPIGTGGCGPCIALIIKCPGGAAVFHFTAGDDPRGSLGFTAAGPTISWWDQGCTAIICGGDDSSGSNCLADEVISAATRAGIKVVGVSGNSACGINPDGSWYASGK